MIVITSDHGEQFHDHGLWRHSNSMYQQLLHVPLLIKYPGQKAGSVVDAPVATIDIMPTILRTLGRDCQACEGRALQDVGTAGFDAPLFAYLMGRTDVRPVLRAIVANGWKLIRVQKPGVTTEELYHLESDPSEERDRRAAEPEIAAQLGHLIDTYELKAGPTPLPDTITLGVAETERLKALGYVQ
jgi:arylsulfatase A-like enzyme